MNARAWIVGVLGIAVGCVPDLREGAGGPAGGKPVDTASGDGTGGSADGGSADGGSADGGSADGGSADGGSADGGSADGGSADGGSADGGGTGTDTGGTGGGTGTDTGGTGGDTGSTDPCTVALPFDTVVVETASVIADANASVLVCSGATASITGSGAVIVVEARGTAVLGGSDARAWVLNRGTVQGLSAPGVVAAEPSATVNDTLGVLTEVACPAITVDTSALPSGC